jgi:hypothetical protein
MIDKPEITAMVWVLILAFGAAILLAVLGWI